MIELKNKLGFLGGLFDPIHNGHLSLCRQIQKKLNLDKILFIPSYHPPHKDRYSDYLQRCKMTVLGILGQPDFELSTLESKIEGPSYTVHTLKRLHLLFPDYEIYFIIGSDNLAKMEEWHKPEEIFRMSTVVMGNRPGEEGRKRGIFEDKLMRIKIEPVNISSTEIREAVKRGESIEHLVPPAVAQYIAEVGLYV